ncbi:MAG: hypothetical protein WC528_05560 [Patescibacteria group bacterium]
MGITLSYIFFILGIVLFGSWVIWQYVKAHRSPKPRAKINGKKKDKVSLWQRIKQWLKKKLGKLGEKKPGEQAVRPRWLTVTLLLWLPLLLALSYTIVKAGGFTDYFRNYADLGWPGNTILIVKLLFTYLFWLVVVSLIDKIWRKKTNWESRIYAVIGLVLLAVILVKAPYLGITGSDKMPLGFAVVEPEEYRFFGVPDSLNLPDRLPQLNNYVTNRKNGQLQSFVTIKTGEIYAVVLEGSVETPNLARYLRQLGRPSSNKMYFPAGPFVLPESISIGRKLLVQTAPYACPIISIRHKTGQIFAWQTAFRPGRPYLIIRALRSGELVAALNLPVSQGIGHAVKFWATRELAEPHVRLLVYRL